MSPSARQEWLTSLLSNLYSYGPEATAAAEFIRQKRTRVSIHSQSTGARWTINRSIELHPRCTGLPPDDPYTISLLIHEVRHLQQGMLIALSVRGELEAWQLQFSFLKDLGSRYRSDPLRDAIVAQLLLLPLNWDRIVLEKARSLMLAYGGKKYRADLLPLYPLPSEIRYLITHNEPLPQRGRHP